jgi:hypothetical protein
MTPAPTLAWAIKAPNGNILPSTIRLSEADTIDEWGNTSWAFYYGKGYRCVRVEVREVSEV